MQRPSNLPASNHYASKDQTVLGPEYVYLWSICTINGLQNSIQHFVKIILANKSQYQQVQARTNVPWYVVASDHMKEASCDFTKCLANGQPWDQKTTIVPIGFGPWTSWVEAAVWAYEHQGISGRSDWTLANCFFRLEGFNGFGYRTGKMQGTTPLNASPYIYNATPFYEKGLAVADHTFDSNKVDDNPGCMALLKALELAGEKIFDSPITTPTTGATMSAANTEETVDSQTLMALATPQGQGIPMKALLDYRDAHLPGHHPNFWATIDFNKPSSDPRLYLFDVKKNSFTQHLVAHGKGSDPANTGMATKFSNVDGSEMSSLGICKGAEIFSGEHGLTMRLDGLETSNSNMRNRAIEMHEADYASATYVKTNGKCGRSWGCTAVDPADKPFLIQSLTGGSLINIWKNS